MDETLCCIAGGGPAGMMLGYLLARAGVATTVLEKHANFFRDFRGDTVHPSTLQILDELGLLDRFLALPHQQLEVLDGFFGTTPIRLGDFRRLPGKIRFIVFMPQWDFLNFIAQEGRALPKLRTIMNADVIDLVRENGRVAGVRVQREGNNEELRATLTIGADGRHSTVRERAGLRRIDIGAPIDALWFRISRDPAAFDQTFGHIGGGKILVSIDRGDYWQCAYVIRKGGFEELRSRGLPAFRQDIATLVPALAPHVDELREWADIKLLTVAIDRLERWDAPGVLCIGDAAHAMSPVGGVGINVAIQDAVATANLLGPKLRAGALQDDDVRSVQRRREWPVKMIQTIQVQAQKAILAPVVSGARASEAPPLGMRVITAWPWLQGLTARIAGYGFRQEHVARELLGGQQHGAST